jgi:hypothetical protein
VFATLPSLVDELRPLPPLVANVISRPTCRRPKTPAPLQVPC